MDGVHLLDKTMFAPEGNFLFIKNSIFDDNADRVLQEREENSGVPESRRHVSLGQFNRRW